jgi:hypothetical protein
MQDDPVSSKSHRLLLASLAMQDDSDYTVALTDYYDV